MSVSDGRYDFLLWHVFFFNFVFFSASGSSWLKTDEDSHLDQGKCQSSNSQRKQEEVDWAALVEIIRGKFEIRRTTFSFFFCLFKKKKNTFELPGYSTAFGSKLWAVDDRGYRRPILFSPDRKLLSDFQASLDKTFLTEASLGLFFFFFFPPLTSLLCVAALSTGGLTLHSPLTHVHVSGKCSSLENTIWT